MSNFKSGLVRGRSASSRGAGTGHRPGAGQHRGFASPGSSPSLWEHPRLPTAVVGGGGGSAPLLRSTAAGSKTLAQSQRGWAL